MDFGAEPKKITACEPPKAGQAAGFCNTTLKKSRNWFLTWNNYSEEEFTSLENWCKLNCIKFVLGRESKEDGKTPHIQGHLYFKSDRSFDALKKVWPKVHFEKTKQPLAAEKYCKKEGDFVEKKSLEDQYEEFMEEDYKNFLEMRQEYPKVVIVDIPRTNENYVCYSTIEKIKDCLFYSGKYEGGCVRLLPCHLIVFANFGPDVLKMSMDRWDIREI